MCVCVYVCVCVCACVCVCVRACAHVVRAWCVVVWCVVCARNTPNPSLLGTSAPVQVTAQQRHSNGRHAASTRQKQFHFDIQMLLVTTSPPVRLFHIVPGILPVPHSHSCGSECEACVVSASPAGICCNRARAQHVERLHDPEREQPTASLPRDVRMGVQTGGVRARLAVHRLQGMGVRGAPEEFEAPQD